MSRKSIQFNEINISTENRRYVETCFQSIFDLSPSDSSVSFDFLDVSGEIYGNILIVSQTRTFLAQCVKEDLYNAMEFLLERILEQLEGWKMQRFEVA